jgi:hypothetical protein
VRGSSARVRTRRAAASGDGTATGGFHATQECRSSSIAITGPLPASKPHAARRIHARAGSGQTRCYPCAGSAGVACPVRVGMLRAMSLEDVEVVRQWVSRVQLRRLGCGHRHLLARTNRVGRARRAAGRGPVRRQGGGSAENRELFEIGWDGQFRVEELIDAGEEVVMVWRMRGRAPGSRIPLDFPYSVRSLARRREAAPHPLVPQQGGGARSRGGCGSSPAVSAALRETPRATTERSSVLQNGATPPDWLSLCRSSPVGDCPA